MFCGGGRHCAIIIPVKHHLSRAPATFCRRIAFGVAVGALVMFHDTVGAFLAAHAVRLTPFPALAPVAALHDIPNPAVVEQTR